MNIHYAKTAAGHAEIQAKAMALSRPVRNLLLLINDSQPGQHWLASIKGLTPADLAQLATAGLIAPAGGAARPAPPAKAAAPAPAASVPSTPPAPAATAKAAPTPMSALAAGDSTEADEGQELWGRVQRAIQDATYTGLYDALTAQGKAQLGLMRGYRFVLEVEKCSGPADLQALALRFATQLRDDHGMAAVKRFYGAIRSV